LASVTLVGPELTVTDAYATAALAMGLDAPAWLSRLPDHAGYVIDAGGHVWWTDEISPRYAPALTA
jgi:thiamine biosynthesis lipoprotein